MSSTGQLSVQAIKGKFEQLQDASNGNDTNSGESLQFRKSNTPFTKTFQSDSFPDELSDSSLTSTRLRSLSVGNPPPSYHDKANNSSQKINRNQSLKQQRQNKNGRMDNKEMNYPNNFTSFFEKQRLVESIVLNIKNNAKKKEEERKIKDYKVKDALSITSKLEKDLKNVLERGSRLKWGSKFTNRSSLNVDKNELTEQDNLNSQQYESMRSKPLTKIDNIVNVDLYPIRACISEDIDISEDRNNKNKPLRSESSPDLSRQRTTSVKLSSNHILSSTENRTRTSFNKKENSLGILQSLISDVEIPQHNTSGVTSSETSPVRPPRRRLKKKRAPQPPKILNICSDESDLTNNAKGDFLSRSYDKRFSDKSDDDNVNLHINDTCDLNKFNYEENYERTLEGEHLFDKEANENTYVTNSARFVSDNDYLSPLNHHNTSYTSNTDETSFSPANSPPKKPPRTFAYEIYHSVKNDQNKSASYMTSKLTAADIESLYTKPLKRLIKDKPISSSSPPLPKPNDSLMKKPVIAPKPTDILSKAKKRFSVVEPMTTRNQREVVEKKSSIRRNSSFRFSFKKNKSAGSPLRQTTLKKEIKIGKKLGAVTRNWSPRREPDKRVRFQSDCNNEDNFDDIGGPIYATPSTNKEKIKESPKELHYMCSPLFKDDERSRESHKENCPPPNRGGLERFGLMDGLRQELRQSYRLVQKRLKSGSNDRRRSKESAVVH